MRTNGRCSRRHVAGFTLIELVVTITISAIVIVFVSMFIAAPLEAYETWGRRAVLVADATDAWPRMETDLRAALPNSLRTRRNGSFVVLEMLTVVDVARYMASPSASFRTAGVFRGIGLPFSSSGYYFSVNNLGTPGANAYALSGSMTPAGTTIQLGAGAPGETLVNVNPAPAFAADSPKHLIYLVSGAVTYLCDESQGTLRRYANYPIAATQTAYDSPAEFAAAGNAGTLVARGLSTCNVAVSAAGSSQSQTVAVRLTTTRNGDLVTLLHSARAEYSP